MKKSEKIMKNLLYKLPRFCFAKSPLQNLKGINCTDVKFYTCTGIKFYAPYH